IACERSRDEAVERFVQVRNLISPGARQEERDVRCEIVERLAGARIGETELSGGFRDPCPAVEVERAAIQQSGAARRLRSVPQQQGEGERNVAGARPGADPGLVDSE